MSAAGSIGIGLVWGWIVGGVAEPLALTRTNAAPVGAATAALAAAAIALAGWAASAELLAAAVVAVALNAGWRRLLALRAGGRI